MLRKTCASSLTLVLLPIVGVSALAHLTFTGWRTPAVVQTQVVDTAAGNTPSTTGQTDTRGVAQRRLSFRGWPLESIGMLWFVLAFALVVAPGSASSDVRARFRFYLFVVSIVGLSLVLWVGYDTWSLGPVAPQYAIAGGTVLAIFLLCSASANASFRDLLTHSIRDALLFVRRWTTWVAVGASVGIVLIPPAPAGSVTEGPVGPEFVAWYDLQPRLPLPESSGTATVLIVEFFDYQCPACKAAREYYRPLFEDLDRRYPGAIRVVRYDFPLERECNSSLPRAFHPAACEAAAAARLAGERGRQREMEAWLWNNQRTLSRESVFAAAERIAGVENVQAQYDRVLESIRSDIEVGRKLGVKGTPAFLVNGVLLTFVPRINMEAVILHELEARNNPPTQLREAVER